MVSLVFGSSDVTEIRILCDAIEHLGWWNEITEVVHGGADGADYLGQWWGRSTRKIVTPFDAAWDDIPSHAKPHQIGYSSKHGRYYKLAGHERNDLMAKYLYYEMKSGTKVSAIGLWHQKSKGTDNMIKQLKHYQIPNAYTVDVDINEELQNGYDIREIGELCKGYKVEPKLIKL